jgi:5'-nucleotidase
MMRLLFITQEGGTSLIRRIHVLHTNDLHSHMSQMSKIHTMVASLRKTWEEHGEESFLLDIGDHMDRVQMITEGTDGQVNRAILETTGYDFITLGNNELLTFTPKQLEQNYKKSSFQVISSNVVDQKTERSAIWMKSYQIVNLNEVRFGFLGVTIPYPIVYEQMGWKVFNPLEILLDQVQQLRTQVDVLILLSHLGLFHDRKLATHIDGIDLIIGAHTHHLLPSPEQTGSAWIAAAGKFGDYLGHLVIDWDIESTKIRQISGQCIPLAEGQNSPEVETILFTYQQIANHRLDKPIAYLPRELIIRYDQESSFGNLLADSLKDWTGTPIAIVNSGQLLESLQAGWITRKQLHQICPHPINPVLLRINGRAIRRSLEESLLTEFINKPIQGFGFRGKILGTLCVSGLQVIIDRNHKIKSIWIGDQCLQDGDRIEIATIDMFTFGIGYLQLKTGTVHKYWLPEFLRDLLACQLQKPEAIERCQIPRFMIG